MTVLWMLRLYANYCLHSKLFLLLMVVKVFVRHGVNTEYIFLGIGSLMWGQLTISGSQTAEEDRE